MTNKSTLNQVEDVTLLKLEYLHPKYWGSWILVSFLFICSYLPFKLQWQVSKGLAFIAFHLVKSRRRIVQVNVDICFSEKTAAEKAALVKAIFHENIQGYIDSGTSWFRNINQFNDRIEVRGLDILKRENANGTGILLAGAHFSILDLAGALTSLVCDLNVTYRPLKNKLMNAVMMRGRYRFVKNAYHKKDVKGFISCMRRGEILWYAPDQDYGRKHSTFSLFFGRTAATITGLTFLSKAGQATVIPYSYHRKGNSQQYLLEFYQPLAKTDSEEQDAANYNAWLETVLRQYPAQYLWLHKRFKTQQDPEQPSPY
ncbi:lipid A biosynthesis lauroyl acyltransferase [Colwellia sp. KU-HH00111]|uniref:LpxL/LpxP family acyltransferase n=1 Tax=Colwellia sp. KU-HH00111 TaxID=3127652 RepID=UPI00310B3BB3